MKKLKQKFKNLFRHLVDGLIYAESTFHKRRAHDVVDGKPRRRVLIMRKDGLGDCIIFYPTLSAYRKYYSDAEITLVFPTYFKTLEPLLGSDVVDNVLWFSHKEFGSNFFYRRRFLLELKRGGYDTFIYPVFTRETIGYFMMKMTGARERIGFEGYISEHGRKSEMRGTLPYTQLIRPPESMKSEIDRDAFFAEKVTGQKVSVAFPTIDINKLSATRADMILRKHALAKGSYSVVFPGSGASYKIWPVEKFVRTIDHLTSKGVDVVVCGGEIDISLVKKIITLADQSLTKTPERARILDLSGENDLSTLAHILANAKFYFGSDTGILHLAVAVGIPTVAIVGVGSLNRFFPYGDPVINRAVYDKTRSHLATGKWVDIENLKPGEIHPSIRDISVDDVEKEIDYMLKYTA